MTKKQYLEARIADINDTLNRRHLPPKYRRNQQHALLFYQIDLERENSINGNNSFIN